MGIGARKKKKMKTEITQMQNALVTNGSMDQADISNIINSA